MNPFRVAHDVLIGYGGDPTTINGVTRKVNCVWSEAELARVAQYLNDDELRHPSYEVMLPAKVLDAPYSLAFGSTLVNATNGWCTVVRKITNPSMMGAEQFVHCICATVYRND